MYLTAEILAGSFVLSWADGEDIEMCALITPEQLRNIYKKPLYPKEYRRQCLWSKKPSGMAYFDIQYHNYHKDLRRYFNKELPGIVSLEEIKNLGDDGLMTVVEGSLGVIVIRKDNWVLQSAVTFLDIKPESDEHKVLWDIYRNVLKRL